MYKLLRTILLSLSLLAIGVPPVYAGTTDAVAPAEPTATDAVESPALDEAENAPIIDAEGNGEAAAWGIVPVLIGVFATVLVLMIWVFRMFKKRR